MKVSQGIHYWLEYHKLHSKKSTLKTYQSVLSKLTVQFGERDLNSLTPEEVLPSLTDINHKDPTVNQADSVLPNHFLFQLYHSKP